ncbi:Chaperone protein DnaK [Pseudonocardia sp. Ae168_Ps1]|uniref:Hsp70 family protein n=1 Tax=unclassified Pseudonocardia TaxID=2619320 RepID=UPI00094B34A7|nr:MULTISPECIES: Hsp70 family protein [unclassified Pseudonocardia]OLL74928.1 Chaperone protein DnaK [Pseudonocardia sp. Ae150A_Ps1]OLL80919.1 Chaperone protein DnaK [Pseudonocardia sp. Ae168_Ps1]OLL84962.1 Chaperone protein DnaK [Pseudonocardia sp. Ae263_Ps1]OLL95021.1 Chaperone protein DnaK [Pseudonocardia sp. Ae356_Ps1]
MSYLLGIDLGATVVTAAVLHGSACDTRALPAVLVATPAGDLLCGEPARRRAAADPDRVARGFLERVGDPTPLSLGGVPYRAEDLCARLVRFLVDEIGARHGGAPSRIGVTHPVSWGRHKRDLLAAALDRHGLTVSLVAAPQAVALAHHDGAPGDRPLAVVDLGGNGSTATVLAPAGPGVLPAVSGRTEACRTGGADVDDAVFAFVRCATPDLAAAFDALDTDDPRVLAALTALRDDCRAAKELLSRDTVATVGVDLPGVRTSVRIHRSDLDELARPLVEPLAWPVEAALAAAPDAEVLLAGGAARMPVAVQVLSAALGRPLAVAADPVHGAARGAALAVAPGAGTSWPGVRIAPVPAAGPTTSRIPAPRGPERAVPVGAGGVPAACEAATASPWAPPGVRTETVAERDGGTAVGLLDAATGPLPAVPARRGAAQPDGRATLPAAPVRPSLRTAAAPVTGVAPALDRLAAPERPAPDTLVTRDADRAVAARSQLRQRILIGAGGLAGIAAVAGAILFWPTQPSFGELSAAPTLPDTTSAPAAPAPVVPGAPAAAGPAAAPGTASPGTAVATAAAQAGKPAANTARGTAGAPAAAAPARPGVPAPVVPPPAAAVPAPAPAPVPVPAGPSTGTPASPAPTTPVTPVTPLPTEGGTDPGPTTPPPATGTTTPVPPAATPAGAPA